MNFLDRYTCTQTYSTRNDTRAFKHRVETMHVYTCSKIYTNRDTDTRCTNVISSVSSIRNHDTQRERRHGEFLESKLAKIRKVSALVARDESTPVFSSSATKYRSRSSFLESSQGLSSELPSSKNEFRAIYHFRLGRVSRLVSGRNFPSRGRDRSGDRGNRSSNEASSTGDFCSLV